MSILIPVSAGEVLDKISILEIKAARIADPAKLVNVRAELQALRAAWASSAYAKVDLGAEHAALRRVNEALWEVEDRLRERERDGLFDAGFIEQARSVYRINDERAAVKRTINLRVGSTLIEEKSYADYRRPAPG
ncbi:MAG: DUF6165 family protein [Gammaproteobacteria bacterium]